MSNVLLGVLISIVTSFAFLFFLWKKLREDYEKDHIFTLGFLSLFGLYIGFGIGRLLPEYWFWTSLVGFCVAFVLYTRKAKLRFYESLEAAAPGLLLFLFVPFLTHAITTQNIVSGVAGGVTLFCIFILFILRKHYKRFTWYKSGKIGFASMVVFGFIFLLRTIIALVLPDTFSIAWPVDILASAIVSFLCFFSLYNLSEI
jgi:hypothetical protein